MASQPNKPQLQSYEELLASGLRPIAPPAPLINGRVSGPVPPPTISTMARTMVGTIPSEFQLDADFAENQYGGQIPSYRLMPPAVSGQASNNSTVVSGTNKIAETANQANSTATTIGNTPVMQNVGGTIVQQPILNNTPVLPGTPTQDNLNDGLTFKRVLYVDEDNTFHISTALNAQGTIPPSAIPANFLTLTSLAVHGGDAGLYVTWAAQNPLFIRADNSQLNIAASSAIPVAAAPTVGNVAGGTRALTTYFVRVAFIRLGCILSIGAESSIAVPANNVLTVQSPPSVAGFDGWLPLYSTSSGQCCVPGELNAAGNSGQQTPIAFGTNYQQPNSAPGGETADAALAVALVPTDSAGPTLAGAGSSTGSGTAWTNPGNVGSTISFAVASSVPISSATQTLGATTFGFAIPLNATITGITVTFTYVQPSGGPFASLVVDLLNVGSPTAKTISSPPSGTHSETEGSSIDLWGLGSISVAAINSASFGCSFVAHNGATGSGTIEINGVQITVSYTLPLTTATLTGLWCGNLAFTTTYSLYPSYDSVTGLIVFANGNRASGGDVQSAGLSISDGQMQLNTARTQFTTLAQPGSGNTQAASTGGGGRNLY